MDVRWRRPANSSLRAEVAYVKRARCDERQDGHGGSKDRGRAAHPRSSAASASSAARSGPWLLLQLNLEARRPPVAITSRPAPLGLTAMPTSARRTDVKKRSLGAGLALV